MNSLLSIDIPPALTLTPEEKVGLLAEALARAPGNDRLRVERAGLLVQRDRFDEALALLSAAPVSDPYRFAARMRLGEAWLSKESVETNRLARAAFAEAAEHAPGPRARAHALAYLGKAQLRLGEIEAGRDSLKSALEADMRNPDAQKRLSAQDFREGKEAEALDRCDALMAQGVLNSRLLGDRYLALSLLGRASEAQETEALEAFFPSLDPAPPADWGSMPAFNQALFEELTTHPATRFERYGTASTKTWRIDNPLLNRLRAFPALLQLFKREIGEQVRSIPPEHPLGRATPKRARLHTWCVMTQEPGFEEWHMHQSGWISGVYYVAVPEEVGRSSDNRGCIEFGNPVLSHIPRDFPGERRTLRPRPGRLLMFPSQAYHRTYPTHNKSWRVAVAFDLIPLEN